MNLKEQLTAKAEEVAALKSAVENGEEGAADKLAEAIEGAKGIQKSIKEAEEAENMLKSISAAEPVADEAPAKTLGEFAAKNLDLSAMKSGMSRSAGTGYGFKAATDAHTAPTIEVVSQNVVDVARQTEIRDLFGAETISGNSLKYFVLGTAEGAPTEVAEGAQKPQFHIPYTPKTASLQKIAGWYYETDELIEDAAFLKSSIDNRGLFELDKAVEAYLATELLGTNGIQAITGGMTADNIFKAMMAVKSATNYDADAIIINPTDYQTLRLDKDGNTQYYGGGYFYGPYGSDAIVKQPGIWGLNTVITTAVTAGSPVIGAFRAGASVVSKAGDGIRVEVVTGDHDDRTNNRVTVVVEDRLALAVRVPAAFAKLTA